MVKIIKQITLEIDSNTYTTLQKQCADHETSISDMIQQFIEGFLESRRALSKA
ncbi:MAG: hypothetical protein JSV20_03555 [Candidatus Bathyarchaeota archaeon]|nr:MAG: hypothetical protein JSV20_03555 [Candidatus Bathyarchaeota archaeon]